MTGIAYFKGCSGTSYETFRLHTQMEMWRKLYMQLWETGHDWSCLFAAAEVLLLLRWRNWIFILLLHDLKTFKCSHLSSSSSNFLG
jgi:hypothetical protein